ncbi:MAG: hypothetical protein GY870_08490 [archaeon]|nr:hypothetical protein [archaeon]
MMEENRFEMLLLSMNANLIKEIAREYNIGKSRDVKIKLSQNKSDLIEELNNILTTQEKKIFYNKYEPNFTKELVSSTVSLITGEDKREKIKNIVKMSVGKGYIIEIKGFQWEETASVKITSSDLKNIEKIKDKKKIDKLTTKKENKISEKKQKGKKHEDEFDEFDEFDDEEGIGQEDETLKEQENIQISEGMKCKCRIGNNGGICRHIMAIYLIMMSRKEIHSEELPFKVKKSLLESSIKKISMVDGKEESDDNVDIMFENYRIYIKGDFVTMQWEGEYSGKKTKDISKEKINIVEDWVCNKVVELITKPLHPKKQEGHLRFITHDNYAVLSKIMARTKLIKKMLKKMQTTDSSLPSDAKELLKLLRENLVEDSNSKVIEFENIVYEPPKKKK